MLKLLYTHNIFNFELNEIIYLFIFLSLRTLESYFISPRVVNADDANVLVDATAHNSFPIFQNARLFPQKFSLFRLQD
jgi:hypothetical protein